MKIVCDSCGAKYSIADEKVQGKVFKIRCKKCSNVIVVKGTDDAANDGYGGAAAEWYVVVDGDQVGPIPSVEIDSYYMAGKIGPDSFVWRDGLSDWVAISTLPEFTHLTQADVAGPDEATQIAESPSFGDEAAEDDATAVASFDAGAIGAAGAAAAAGDDDLFGGASPSDETINAGVSDDYGGGDYGGGDDYGSSGADFGGDDYGGRDDFGSDMAYGASAEEEDPYGGEEDGYGGFSAAAAGGSGGSGGYGAMDASDAGEDDGGGMFAAFDSGADEDDGSDFMSFGGGDSGSGASANGSGAGAGSGGGFVSQNDMVGQRNENSVLFSLSSLDQVSAVPGDGGGGAPTGGGGAPASGGDGPVTEGSGLIDIRALASAHESMKGGGADGDDELDPFAHGTMSMPALMPMGSHRSNKPLIFGAAIAGILFLGLVGVVLVIALGGDDKENGGEQVIIKEVIKEVAVPSASDGEDEAKEKAEAEAAAAAAKEAAEDGDTESETEKAEAEAEEKAEKKAPTKTARKSSTKSKSSGSPSSRSTKKGDDIDNLINNIGKKDDSSSGSSGSDNSGSSSSGLKKKLSKNDVLGGIKRYSSRVRTCYTSHNSKNLSGTMKVKFYIKPDGRVTNVSVVTGKFKGTDVGGCVSKVVRRMRFPATSASSNVPVTYPFILK